ncbi:MAG: hypothetical protein ABSE68_02505 [Minisyncoccia bacterium]
MKENEIVKFIGEPVVLRAANGMEVIANAEDVFSVIDTDFKECSTEFGPGRKETPVQVCEVVKDSPFERVFTSLSSDLKKICLTQHQIKMFCREYAERLRGDEYGTYILFETVRGLSVATILAYPKGPSGIFGRNFSLKIFKRYLKDERSIYSLGKPRIVVPVF